MSELDDTASAKPQLRSLSGAAQMMAHRWPHIVLTTFAIIMLSLSNLARPLVIQRAIDSGLLNNDSGAIVEASLIFVVLAVAAYAFQGLSTYLVSWIGQGFIRDLRMRLFTHLQRLSMSFYDKENSGRLLSRMSADTVALTDMISNAFLLVAQSALLLTGTIVILLFLSWQLSLVALIVVPPLVVGTAIFRVYSARAYDAVRDRIADVLVHIQESFAGMKVVKAFARERYNIERFGEINEANYHANLRAVRIAAVYIPFIELLAGLGVGIVLYFGGRGVFGAEVSVGTVAAFLFYLSFIFQPIQQLSMFIDMLQQGTAALNKIFALLAIEPAVREPESATPLPHAVEGRVRFEHVTFGYDPANPVLHDVGLEIPSGQRVALVGATGAGKSTIARLMMRFYDPTGGRVLFDDIDLRELSLADLRRSIVMIPQEGFLFGGTIRENILFGQPDATDEQVIQACTRLGIHDFVMSLPGGYDTHVSHRGSRLSAGEKQLVSLARAFLADPAVLILDEATSSLDPGTEVLVEMAMRQLLAGRTSVVVAHRLSTAEHAERVLLIDDGRVIEDGHHDELLALDGEYAKLFHQWSLSLPEAHGAQT
ncbi:MAG: ABC transporter ATP-binding protein [Chloroflexi bacterium]|nr:ABC transporter ATP-binding protein [Chloroflexota bacterium]